MRHYATDSPQAAARIVSMAALADGHVCSVECAFRSSKQIVTLQKANRC